MLSDRDIRSVIKKGLLTFRPSLARDQIGPASIDLRLGDTFMIFKPGYTMALDPRNRFLKKYMDVIRIPKGKQFVLHPKDFVVAATHEYIKVPDSMVVRVEGKSTLARMGILVHTAGFVDPGYEGAITLEISNHSGFPVLLYPKMYICQIAVSMLSSPAEVPYNKRKKSLYYKHKGPAPADTKNLF